MWNGLHQTQPAVEPIATQLKDRPGVRIIPYDYVARFKLQGKKVGNLIEDVINISVEGTFVAVAVGYGLEADSASTIELIPTPGQNLENLTLQKMRLANVPLHVLMDGFRFNPALEQLAFPNGTLDNTLNGTLDNRLNVDLANRKGLFQHIRPIRRIGEDFNFLFNFIDTGSGRELQNAPIHSIAGLGKSNGERPFRMLAKPLAFLPRSSVRIQVEERSADVKGNLYIVLHGYKILGAAGVAEEHLRVLYQKAIQRFGTRAASAKVIKKVEQKAIPSNRLVPFDYVQTMDLTGQKGNVVEGEININVEGGFVATSIGYSLAVADSQIRIDNLDECIIFELTEESLRKLEAESLPKEVLKKLRDKIGEAFIGRSSFLDMLKELLGEKQFNAYKSTILNVTKTDFVDLNCIHLSDFTSTDLKGGFRIRPEVLRLAFVNGRLNTRLHILTVAELFEPLNLPEKVNFLYSILDTGTGRDWQNQPVHNIAGLGIANGDRPFRNLAWPMHFLPRSTIRLRVEEIFGRGRLFIVFQGYKILGAK